MHRSLIKIALCVKVLGTVALAGCGGSSENLPPPPPPTPPEPVATTAPEPPPAPTTPATPPPPPAPPVTLAAGTASPDPTPAPSVKIVAPAKGQTIKKDKAADFAVKLDVKNWLTAEGSSHVHLILDNRPYKAIYDTKAPVKLSELTNGEPLAEGQHVLVAFPSRANHESVKLPGALVVTEFVVEKKGETTIDVKKPLLVYSRPKGEYKGETANHVLVDFQLANTTLGEGKGAVSIEVTGPGIDKPLTAKVDKFGTPYFLEQLRSGSYKVKLELLGADGKLVPGPWNSTTREIKVDREAPAEDPHGGHSSVPSKPSPNKPESGAANPAKTGPGGQK